MQTPLISVIIPAYNAEKYIEQCIDSIQKNTYENLEIIVVNDGSKDNTRQTVEAISDSRIRLINQENGGVSRARNTGLDHAMGEYIAFIDSDDYVSSDYFERLSAGEADIMACRHICVSRTGELLKDPFPNVREEIAYTPQQLADRYFHLTTGVINSCCGKLYKRQVIGTTRFSETLKWGEDASFNLQCFQKMEQMRVLPDKNYFYVMHSTQATAKKMPGYGQMLLEYVANIHAFLEKYQAYDSATIRKGMGNRCLSDFFTAATHAENRKHYKQLFLQFRQTPWYPFAAEARPKKRLWKTVQKLVLSERITTLYGLNRGFNFLVKAKRTIKKWR